MKSEKRKTLIVSVFLFIIFAASAISITVSAVGWRPLKNFELAEAVYYLGPTAQYVYSEEKTALIAEQIQALTVHFKEQAGELIDGYAGVLRLTDTKGRTVVLEITSVWLSTDEGTAQISKALVTIDGESYTCDSYEQIAELERIMDETWHKYFSPQTRALS